MFSKADSFYKANAPQENGKYSLHTEPLVSASFIHVLEKNTIVLLSFQRSLHPSLLVCSLFPLKSYCFFAKSPTRRLNPVLVEERHLWRSHSSRFSSFIVFLSVLVHGIEWIEHGPLFVPSLSWLIKAFFLSPLCCVGPEYVQHLFANFALLFQPVFFFREAIHRPLNDHRYSLHRLDTRCECFTFYVRDSCLTFVF